MTLSWLDPSPKIEAMKPELAILPMASLDGVGEGLPWNANVEIVSEIARRTASKCSRRVLLLPCWPYGTSGGSTGVSLEYKTLWAVVKDIVESLLQHDIRQVAIINGLGTTKLVTALPVGNEIIKTGVRQLNYENPGLHAIWIQPFRAGREILKIIFPGMPAETLDNVARASMLMHLGPGSEATLAKPAFSHLQYVSPDRGEQALAELSDSVAAYIEKSLELLMNL